MSDWKEALDAIESLVAFAYEQGFHELGWKPEKVVRAHIEGLEAARDAGADLDCNERRDDADFWWNVAAFRAVELGRQIEIAEAAEARVRELEAVAGYAEHRVDCRHATFAAEACDCGLDAAIDAMLPAVRDDDSRVEAEGK